MIAFLDRVCEQGIELHSIMVVRHGHVVAEGWWDPFTADRPHLLYSMSKSFTSIAVGLAVADGLVGLNDRVVDLLPDHVPDDVAPQVSELTVHHLLLMTTGHTEDVLEDAWALEPLDLVRGFLRIPPARPAGTVHAYNNPTTYVLARIVEHVTGRPLPEMLDERLFRPMGIGPGEWDRDITGHAFGFHGLHLTTEAAAAFGELLLRRGQWNGHQVVPRGWLDLATRRHIPTLQFEDGTRAPDWLQGYGYQFWMSRHGYRADGAMGQFCLVVPEADVVVAMTAATTSMQSPLDAVWECLLPALDQPGQVDADAEVRSRLSALALPRIAGEHRPDRAVEAVVDHLDQAPPLARGTRVEATPDAHGWRVRIGDGATAFQFQVGHDTWRESTPLRRPVVAAGAWQGEVLIVDLYVITSPSRVRLTIAGTSASAEWNMPPLVGPELRHQLL
ncbi:serine hydrolase [Actinopolymorpha sp. B17G11]|uniref:serine hydrolase domain-containing protein n=1 Tax=Actinopolymorpha sp. B17G11 TaxID=3160861 RepID=UPI0032E51D3F